MSCQTHDVSHYWTQLPAPRLALRERPSIVSGCSCNLTALHTSAPYAERTALMDWSPSSPQRTSPTLPASLRPAAVPRNLLVGLTGGVAGTVLFLGLYTIERGNRPGYSACPQTITTLRLHSAGWS